MDGTQCPDDLHGAMARIPELNADTVVKTADFAMLAWVGTRSMWSQPTFYVLFGSLFVAELEVLVAEQG